MVGVAQLVEHLVVVQVAAGSSPVTHPTDGSARRRWRGPTRFTSGASGGLVRDCRQLHDGWLLDLVRPAPGALVARLADVPATVPGCVHTDLMAAGLLADPYLDRNEDAQHWVGDSDWRYRTTLQVADEPADDRADRVDLVFDGLDTVADISWDGAPLGRTRNMHR